MPIYEYSCLHCKHKYSVFYKTYASVTEEEQIEECPKCRSKFKKKLITKSSFELKGRGWAKDGYK